MSEFSGNFRSALKNSAVFRVIIILECCVLLIMAANCLRGRCEYSFTSDNLYTPSGLGEWTYDESGTGYRASSAEALGDNILVNTDFFALYPGSYKVRVTYASQVSYLDGINYTVGTGYLNLNSAHNDVYYHFDSMLLRDGLSSAEQTLQVTSPWKISDFQMTLSYSGQGSLTVYSIEITENTAYKYLGFLGMLLLFALLDIFCYLMFMGSGFPYIKELGILTLICAAACLPFLTDWIFVGEDSALWAAGVRLLAEEISGGSYLSSINDILRDSGANGSALAGGSLFLYLPAFLFCCGFSLTFVYNFYLCVMSIIICLVTYYCALRIFGKSNSALLASAMYTLSAPRLTCILSLASLGEMTAMVFMPFILLGFYEIYTAPGGEKIRAAKYVPVVIGLTGVINSYAPAFWMSGLLMIVCCVLLIKKTVQPTRIAALAKAVALTVLVNLAPVMLGMTDIDILSKENSALAGGAYLVQIFNSIVNNYQPEEMDWSYAAGDMSMSVGFSVTLGIVLFLVHIAKKGWGDGRTERGSDGFAALCMGMALFAIFLSSVYMFYDYLDFLPESFLFILSGRLAASGWLPFAALFGVFCTCGIAESRELKEVFQGVPVILLLCMALTVNTGQIYSDQMRTSSMERLSNNLYENLDRVGATETYLSDMEG